MRSEPSAEALAAVCARRVPQISSAFVPSLVASAGVAKSAGDKKTHSVMATSKTLR